MVSMEIERCKHCRWETEMKRKILALLCMVMLCVSACTNPKEKEQAPEADETYDYEDVEEMDEVTVEGNKIIFALYENQAIPYRWTSNVKGSGITLLSEESVDGQGNMFSVGVSPSYHIFTFEWNTDGEAEIEFIHARYDSTDRDEASEIRKFLVTKQGDTVTYVEQ